MRQTQIYRNYQIELAGHQAQSTCDELIVWVRAESVAQIQQSIVDVRQLVQDIKEIEREVVSVDATLPQDESLLTRLVQQRFQQYYADAAKITALVKALQQMLQIQIDAHLYSHHKQLFDEAENAIKRAEMAMPLRGFDLPHTVLTDDNQVYQHRMQMQAEDSAHAHEQLYDHYRSMDETLVALHDASDDAGLLHHLQDNDYWMAPVVNRSVWIEVGALLIYLRPLEDGVSLHVCPAQSPDIDLHQHTVYYSEAEHSKCARKTG